MKAPAQSRDTRQGLRAGRAGRGTAFHRTTKIDLPRANHYIRWNGYPSRLFQVPCSRLLGMLRKFGEDSQDSQSEPLPQIQDLLRTLTAPENCFPVRCSEGLPSHFVHYLTYATYSKGVRNVRFSALSQAIARNRSTWVPGLRGVFGPAEQGSQARVCGNRCVRSCCPRSPCPSNRGGQPYRRLRGCDATTAPRYLAKGHRNHRDHGPNPRDQQESLG